MAHPPPPPPGNAPAFDPLRCPRREEDDMFLGYLEGWRRAPPSRDTLAYAWGRRNAANDRARAVDPEQAEAARRAARAPPPGRA